jgi:hypothetical protein
MRDTLARFFQIRIAPPSMRDHKKAFSFTSLSSLMARGGEDFPKIGDRLDLNVKRPPRSPDRLFI